MVVTGDAGAGAAVPGPCASIVVKQDLITDFSDAFDAPDFDGHPGGVSFTGGPVERGGVSYRFAAPGLDPPRLSLEPRVHDLALRIEAAPRMPIDGNYYLGVAFGFSAGDEVCIDASAYRGVQFTLDGTTGTCQLMFQVERSEDYRIGPNTKVASCTLGELCYPPFSPPLIVDGQRNHAIPFADLTMPGNPIPEVNPKAITGVGFKLFAPVAGPPCVASLVVDDLAFFR
jgi:hypothetical protein